MGDVSYAQQTDRTDKRRIAGDRALNRINGRAWITTKVKLRGRSRLIFSRGASRAPDGQRHGNLPTNKVCRSSTDALPKNGRRAAMYCSLLLLGES
jgi:hypothetical protein